MKDYSAAEVAKCLLTWTEFAVGKLVEQDQIINSQAGEIEAMKLMLSPPAVLPIAEVPVRVLSLAINEELEPE